MQLCSNAAVLLSLQMYVHGDVERGSSLDEDMQLQKHQSSSPAASRGQATYPEQGTSR